MERSIFQPGDLLASFRIEAHEENFGSLQCFHASHFHSDAKALIYVRDLRQWPLSSEALHAFKERAERLRRLRVDHVNPLLEADLQDGMAWAAFAAPEGDNLLDFKCDHGPLNVMAGAALLRSIGKALHEARFAGVHGMLKSTVIYLDTCGTLRSVDHFGLATLFEMRPETPLNAAPERWKERRPPTARMDIFSAAAIVWEAIAGDEPGAILGHDPLRNERIKQPYPPLRSVRPEVPQGFSEMLADWLSHDENERPASWVAALIELECHLEGLSRFAHTQPTAENLAQEDAEPATLPSSLIVQTRMAPRAAESVQAAPEAQTATPGAASMEHADTIPAPPPASALFENTSPTNSTQSAEPSSTESAVKPAALKPSMEAGSNTEAPAARRSSKAKAIALSSFAALFLMGGTVLAVLTMRTAERAPHMLRLQNHVYTVAQTSTKIGISEGEKTQDNNTRDPISDTNTRESPHRPRSGQDAQKAETQGGSRDPDAHINVRIYAATQSN